MTNMQIQPNRDFGPAFVIVRNEREIACAHRREDAEAFVAGAIGADELYRRNEGVEKETARTS